MTTTVMRLLDDATKLDTLHWIWMATSCVTWSRALRPVYDSRLSSTLNLVKVLHPLQYSFIRFHFSVATEYGKSS